MTKQVSNKDRNIKNQIATTKENTLEELSEQKTWSSDGYFKSQVTNYNMEKINYSKNSLFYVNQAFLTIQKSKNMYYGNHFVLAQVMCVVANEFKVYSFEYDTATGQFLGRYETVSLIMVIGDNDETFFNMSKIRNQSFFYLYQKLRILNSLAARS